MQNAIAIIQCHQFCCILFFSVLMLLDGNVKIVDGEFSILSNAQPALGVCNYAIFTACN